MCNFITKQWVWASYCCCWRNWNGLRSNVDCMRVPRIIERTCTHTHTSSKHRLPFNRRVPRAESRQSDEIGNRPRANGATLTMSGSVGAGSFRTTTNSIGGRRYGHKWWKVETQTRRKNPYYPPCSVCTIRMASLLYAYKQLWMKQL